MAVAVKTKDENIFMTDQVGESEAYSYDLNDNLKTVTDRENQTTGFVYDALDRMTIYNSPGSGNHTTYTYDDASRITDIEETVSTSLVNSVAVAWTNSASGDDFEDRAKTVTTDSAGITNTVTYDYDKLGRRKSMQIEGQAVVDYTYDDGGFMTLMNTTVSGTSMSFSLAYDAAGRRESLTYQYGVTNAVTATYGYEATGMVNSIAFTNSTSGELESVSYIYDEIYNRTSMTRADMPVLLPTALADTTYNEANRLTAFNGESIDYDKNGSMTEVIDSCGTTTYTWDAKNRLTGISGYDEDCEALTASYKYDPLNRRIEKTVNTVTTKYLYDGWDIVQEMDENDVPTVYYIRTPNIDEPLARIELDSEGSVEKIRFYLADALGSVIALTDETGTIKTQYNYSPFGVTEVIGEASDNPFQYTGRENDGDTGLYYYRARYYSPEMGRFISEDPIGLAGGINMYAYVGNQPVNFRDPLGLVSNDQIFIHHDPYGPYGPDYGPFPPAQPVDPLLNRIFYEVPVVIVKHAAEFLIGLAIRSHIAIINATVPRPAEGASLPPTGSITPQNTQTQCSSNRK